LNKSVFPRKGAKLQLLARYITQDVVEEEPESPYLRLFVDHHERVALNPWWSIYFKFWGASVQTKKPISSDKMVYMGSQIINGTENVPFLGLEFMELDGRHGITGLIGAQYEFLKNWYLLYEFNMGKTSNKFEYLWKDITHTQTTDIIGRVNENTDITERYIYGGGITIGAETAIGPVQVTLTRNSRDSDLNAYFSIGYQF